MIADLHSHSNCSDGTLSPNDLLARASDAGVELFSVTDHDTINAYLAMLNIPHGLKLIPGIEFSTTWQNKGVHIVGLNIDLTHNAAQEGANSQSQAREIRAHKIAEKLEKQGLKNTLEGARKFAHGNFIGRPHFAQHLVACGAAANMQQAFKRYLGAGKAGDVKQLWASMADIIGWINDSGGTAVLAHPLKYKLTMTKLKTLADDFIQLGGRGIEVVSGQQKPEDTHKMAQLCQQKNLLASTGSDFHSPEQPWAALGKQPKLPEACQPIWENW